MEPEARSEKLSAAPEGAAEAELIDETTWGAVRALVARGLTKKAIARQLDLDIKIVRKWCRQSWAPQRRQSRGRMLAPWEEFLRARAPEVGFNGAVLHRELVQMGCLCSYRASARKRTLACLAAIGRSLFALRALCPSSTCRHAARAALLRPYSSYLGGPGNRFPP